MISSANLRPPMSRPSRRRLPGRARRRGRGRAGPSASRTGRAKAATPEGAASSHMQVNPHSLLQEDGPHSDAVVSCRVRLARNLAGFPFVNRASDAQRGELVKMAKNVLLGCGIDAKMIWVDMQK